SIRDIDREKLSLTARVANHCVCGVATLVWRLLPAGDNHLRALLREAQRCRAPDPGPTTRYERNLAVQPPTLVTGHISISHNRRSTQGSPHTMARAAISCMYPSIQRPGTATDVHTRSRVPPNIFAPTPMTSRQTRGSL